MMALFLEGRPEWIFGPVRQILPYHNHGFPSLVLARKPFFQMKLLISVLVISIFGDALIDGGGYCIWIPPNFPLMLSAAVLEAS